MTHKIYWYPSQDKVMFDEHEVRKLSLDQYGENIPYIDGELTIFNNYFFDFWGYYLNAEGTSLYGHLKRHAYGDKDWCFPNFNLISEKMDKSRKTLHTYLDILERYGFVYQFGVINTSKKNAEESSVFKIRKSTPLLTKNLIYGNPDIEIPDDAPPHIVKALKKEKKGLPPKLREEHEKFVSKRMQNNTDQIEQHVDFEKIYTAWMQYGEVLKNNKPELQPTKFKHKHNTEMNEHEEVLLKYLLNAAQNYISKPSFDTWFKDISVKIKIDEKKFIIFAPNEFARDWLQQKYEGQLIGWIEELGFNVEKLEFEHS